MTCTETGCAGEMFAALFSWLKVRDRRRRSLATGTVATRLLATALSA
jgi:hypothetical protein